MVSTRPLISKSSSPFNNPMVTVARTPITVGIIVTFMFHYFFHSLARSWYLSFFSLSFNFTLWSAGTAKSTIVKVLFVVVVVVDDDDDDYNYYYKVWSSGLRLGDPFPFRVFHTSVSRWFLIGVWVTVVSSSLQDSSQYSTRLLLLLLL